MAIESKDLIQEYFDEVKDKYPSIPLEKFTVICRAPFMFFKKIMALRDFPRINVKYFGKFVVFPGSAKNIIKLMEISLKSGWITQEQFDERTANLKAYVNEYESQGSPDSQGEEAPI